MKTIIEETAIELAAAFYENCRMMGMDCKPYRNQRHYVRNNFEKFIPKAVDLLTSMLDGGYPEEQKKEIYEALLSRAAYRPTINGVQLDLPLSSGVH